MALEPDVLTGAANRFVGFFRELQTVFVEREEVLQQLALALLSRQHLLMTGPPGTAKSKLAQAVLGRIHCEQTRLPSLFARQFTESTVQTDLVGPIDFKTLMETGRTEHFTDEGMLGAAHAFLDEVFDGRDMLLRSTLNLLNERELKQGTKVSRGKIECAVMTTNRYLAEVLENDRLLAFVDRVAFLSFVPKGFADAGALTEVLRRQVGGKASANLSARLSVQDLDVLQEAVDAVPVSEALCRSVAALAQSFDAALAAARRADASFIPSRYVSTRGIVRLGELLRAVCVYDWLFRDPQRPRQARVEDLAGLRLGLTLCGPTAGDCATLLKNESDPRERRQLEMVLAERELFDRCLQSLPAPLETEPPPSPVLARSTAGAIRGRSPSELAELAHELAARVPSNATERAELAQHLDATVRALGQGIVREGLQPGGASDHDPLPALAELVQLADKVEGAWAEARPLARWLRRRVLDLLSRIATLGPNPFAAGMNHERALTGHLDGMRSVAEIHLQRTEQLASLRAALRLAGTDEPGADSGGDGLLWQGALQRVVERLAPDLAQGVAARLRDSARPDTGGLAVALDLLGPHLALVRETADRLEALGGDGRAFMSQVLAAPLGPLISEGWAKLAGSRTQITEALAADLAALTQAELLDLLAVPALAPAMMRAVLQHQPAVSDIPASGARFTRYRQLRRSMPPQSLCFTLVDLLSRFRQIRDSGDDPDQLMTRVAAVVRTFPADLRAQLLSADRAFVETPVAFIEQWWQELAASLPPKHDEALGRLMESDFFTVTHGECALARFALEARLVELVLEEAGPALAPLQGRIAALTAESSAVHERLARQRLAAAGAARGGGRG